MQVKEDMLYMMDLFMVQKAACQQFFLFSET